MFKVGDVVERLAYSTQGVVLGSNYVVEWSNGTDLRLIGHKNTFFSGYFTLVKREENGTNGVAPLAIQHGGNHYKKLKIQPVEYIMANGIPYMEGNVIKYCTRWKDKGGIEDLKKAKHYLEILIENEQKND